jgi:hypothetical protein
VPVNSSSISLARIHFGGGKKTKIEREEGRGKKLEERVFFKSTREAGKKM